MRIAFVSANRESMPDPVVPLGLLCVMEATPQEHQRLLIDLFWQRDPTAYLGDELQRFAPTLVAVGLRNLQNSDYSGSRDNIAYYNALMRCIRQSTPAPVVLGGGGFSVAPRALMKSLGADFGIAGEGELAFLQLLCEIERGAVDYSSVGGLLWHKDGALVQNPAQASFASLDQLKAPHRSQVDPRYYTDVGVESVQSKRGCALACDYCTYPTIEGHAVRTRAPNLVVDELFACKEEHPTLNHFFIVDSVFNIPPRHAKAVCREMLARGFATPWTCYANPLGFDSELAELMAKSGCAGMEIGSDSGCDEVLTRLCKGFGTKQIEHMHQLCTDYGLRDCHTFVLGTRGETLAQVQQSLDFLQRLDPFAAIVMVWTDDDEAFDAKLATARRRLRDSIAQLIRERARDKPRWIVPSLQQNFDARLFRLLRRRGLAGPLWQHLGATDNSEAARFTKLGGAANGAPRRASPELWRGS